MFVVHFSELKQYKHDIYQAGLKLLSNPIFREEKEDWQIVNYYQDGTPLPQVLVDAVKEVIKRRNIITPLDYNTMCFIISSVVYEGCKHLGEFWDDYYILDNYIVNGNPLIFKYSHVSLLDLQIFDGRFFNHCFTFYLESTEKEELCHVIQGIIISYLTRDVFDNHFQIDVTSLPLHVRSRLEKDANDIYTELLEKKLEADFTLNTILISSLERRGR